MLEGNKKTALGIESRYYFRPMKESLEERITELGEIEALDSLTQVMEDAKPEVEAILNQRRDDGHIVDIDQARKTVAGNGFQGLIAYSLIKLQEADLLNPELAIVLKPKKHDLIEKYVSIRVGDEIQKPDIDILVYMHKKFEKYPVTIYSVKTSLKESAGQTYWWKLLMDLARSENCRTIREKYDLRYKAVRDSKVGFITADLYDEAMQPQKVDILRFFDFAYVTKSESRLKSLSSFSKVVEDLNTMYAAELAIR
jgi:type II restriction enzyme